MAGSTLENPTQPSEPTYHPVANWPGWPTPCAQLLCVHSTLRLYCTARGCTRLRRNTMFTSAFLQPASLDLNLATQPTRC